MRKKKGFLFLTLVTVSFLFASGESEEVPDSLRDTTSGIDTGTVSHAEADSAKTDTTLVDSLKAAADGKREQPEEPTLPELEIVKSRFVAFFDKELVLQGGDLVCNARFIVLGKAVYGHFDFMMIGDSGTIITTVSTDNRSYRSDKGGRPKSLTMRIGPAAGCALVKASFHEMRIEPENGLCTEGK